MSETSEMSETLEMPTTPITPTISQNIKQVTFYIGDEMSDESILQFNQEQQYQQQYQYPYSHANSYPYPHANANSYPYPHTNSYPYPHANANSYPYPHANTNSYPYPHANANSYQNEQKSKPIIDENTYNPKTVVHIQNNVQSNIDTSTLKRNNSLVNFIIDIFDRIF